MKNDLVNKIREFNRLYLPMFNLLGNNYLSSKLSATEARVLFEIYNNDGCSATIITRTLNIDKSYLSRIIKSHEKKGYVSRLLSENDNRTYSLHLTNNGVKKTEELILQSNNEIFNLIKDFSSSDCQELNNAFSVIMNILG